VNANVTKAHNAFAIEPDASNGAKIEAARGTSEIFHRLRFEKNDRIYREEHEMKRSGSSARKSRDLINNEQEGRLRT